MLSPKLLDEFAYPESDGKPMGETDWHIDAIFMLRDILRRHFQDQRVYVGSDLLVYYHEGRPHEFVVPDVFVALDCPPGPRRVFKTWEEHRTPDVVFEITSRSTARDDAVFKPKTYQQLSVRELFLYDPTAEYLNPPLKGFRLSSGTLESMVPDRGSLRSEVLGITLSLDGRSLKLADSESGLPLLTTAEAEQQARAAERLAAKAEIDKLRCELERLRRKHRE